MKPILPTAAKLQDFYLKLVRTELKPLAVLKEEPEIMARLEEKIARHNQPFTRITPTKPRKKQR